MKKASALLLAAIVVVLVLVIAYAAAEKPDWAHLDYWKVHYSESPDQIYRRSAGGYDEAAALALERTEAAAALTPADHHRAATIIHRNIISQEHRPQADVQGRPTANDHELSRLRLQMFGRAREHYMAALAGFTNQAVAREEADRAGRRFGLPRAEEPPAEGGAPGAGFIIDAALQFAFGGLETLLNNDPLLAVLFADQAAEPTNRVLEIVILPDGELAGAAENRRDLTIQTRRAAAAEVAAETGAGGRGARAAAFLDLSQQHTSDPQNSHDPSVNAAKRAVVARLRAGQGSFQRLPTLDQIVAEIRLGSDVYSNDPRTGRPRPALTEKAIAVVRRGHNGERSTSAGASDEEVLRRVWARADDPQNKDQRDNLRQAAYDALVDSWEPAIGGDQIQCVDGRISRMIGSFATLDFDERNWVMRRLEQHKNDIFTKTKLVVRAAAEDAAALADNAELQKVGQAFLATTQAELKQIGELNPGTEESFITATRARIERMIDDHVERLDEVVRGAVPAHALDAIKKEALASI